MTNFPELFSALAVPFETREVRVRTETEGRQIHYITARTAMNRLDSVLGPENWWDEYLPGANSVLCKLTVRLPDGSTVTKADAGGYARMADSGDDDKSGFSDSFKRAAAKFGVARYLYGDGVPYFVQQQEPATNAPVAVQAPTPVPVPPPVPVQTPTPAPAPVGKSSTASGSNRGNQPPRTGRALFAWAKEQEQHYELDLVKHLNSWAKLQDHTGRMVDWDAEQVSQAYTVATRKFRASVGGRSEAYEHALTN